MLVVDAGAGAIAKLTDDGARDGAFATTLAAQDVRPAMFLWPAAQFHALASASPCFASCPYRNDRDRQSLLGAAAPLPTAAARQRIASNR